MNLQVYELTIVWMYKFMNLQAHGHFDFMNIYLWTYQFLQFYRFSILQVYNYLFFIYDFVDHHDFPHAVVVFASDDSFRGIWNLESGIL